MERVEHFFAVCGWRARDTSRGRQARQSCAIGWARTSLNRVSKALPSNLVTGRAPGVAGRRVVAGPQARRHPHHRSVRDRHSRPFCGMTDLCAELMHAQLEMDRKGFGELLSREERVAVLTGLPPGVAAPAAEPPGDDSVTKENPLAPASATSASTSSAGAQGIGAAESPPAKEPPGNDQLTMLELALWLAAAVGQMSPWTAMGAFASAFKAAHGGSILLELNAAYFVPALPTLMFSMAMVPFIDRWLGHQRGFALRVIVCQAIISGSVMLFPSYAAQGGKALPIAVSVVIGIFGGLGYGSIFAFNGFWPTRAAAVFSLGLFLPGFLFIALHAIVGFEATFPPTKENKDAHWYFGGAAGFLGLAAFLGLLFGPRGTAICAEKDAQAAARASAGSAKRDSAGVELIGMSEASDPEATLSSSGAPKHETGGPRIVRKSSAADRENRNIALRAAWNVVWPSLLSIFISIFAIVCITSFFTAAPSPNPSLPATLFFVKNGCDFLGKALTLLPPLIRSQWQLVLASAVRFVPLPLFFLHVFTPVLGRNDVFLIALVAASAVISGYLNTSCFQIAAKTVNAEQRPAAKLLVNLSFQTSLLASIALSFTIMATA